MLFGHLHRRVRCVPSSASGALDAICASGAALDHRDSSIRAGLNLYQIDDAGATATVQAHVLDPSDGVLRPTTIAETTGCA